MKSQGARNSPAFTTQKVPHGSFLGLSPSTSTFSVFFLDFFISVLLSIHACSSVPRCMFAAASVIEELSPTPKLLPDLPLDLRMTGA